MKMSKCLGQCGNMLDKLFKTTFQYSGIPEYENEYYSSKIWIIKSIYKAQQNDNISFLDRDLLS